MRNLTISARVACGLLAATATLAMAGGTGFTIHEGLPAYALQNQAGEFRVSYQESFPTPADEPQRYLLGGYRLGRNEGNLAFEGDAMLLFQTLSTPPFYAPNDLSLVPEFGIGLVRPAAMLRVSIPWVSLTDLNGVNFGLWPQATLSIGTRQNRHGLSLTVGARASPDVLGPMRARCGLTLMALSEPGRARANGPGRVRSWAVLPQGRGFLDDFCSLVARQ